MKVYMLRGTVIRHEGGQAFTVEPGDVLEVSDEFGAWLVIHQKAREMPETDPEQKKSGIETADLPKGETRAVTARGGKKK